MPASRCDAGSKGHFLSLCPHVDSEKKDLEMNIFFVQSYSRPQSLLGAWVLGPGGSGDENGTERAPFPPPTEERRDRNLMKSLGGCCFCFYPSEASSELSFERGVEMKEKHIFNRQLCKLNILYKKTETF